MRPPSRPLLRMRLVAALMRANGDRSAPSQALLRQMWFAVLQRAHAARWEAIARALGRRPETCRRWTRRFAPYWDYLFRAAESYALEKLVREAAMVLAVLGNQPGRRQRRPPAG